MDGKIVILPKYGSRAASMRQRFLQYEKFINKSDMHVEYWPLFSNTYLEKLFLGKKPTIGHIARLYVDRLRKLTTYSNAKIFWLHCEAFPYLPFVFENIVRWKHIPVVFDYDDAIFHNYDLHHNPFIRRLLGRKIDQVMAASTIVFAGNNYLAERARNAGARDVRIIPTVVDTTRYQVISRENRTEPRIGWIGSPSTWEQYLKPMMPMLGNVAANAGAMINVVGAPPSTAQFPETKFLPWSEETEVSLIQDMDIGIMPLDDSPWARGKCGYKLIQYMACGLPVVASPVGVNAEIVENGVNGFLARNDSEWREALMTLLNDPGLRGRMGAAGRKKVEREYSLQVYGPKVAQIFRELIEGKGASR